jgi:hypothetical protein
VSGLSNRSKPRTRPPLAQTTPIMIRQNLDLIQAILHALFDHILDVIECRRVGADAMTELLSAHCPPHRLLIGTAFDRIATPRMQARRLR